MTTTHPRSAAISPRSASPPRSTGGSKPRPAATPRTPGRPKSWFPGNPIGPVALSILAFTAVAGIGLAAYGYGRGSIGTTTIGILAKAGTHSSLQASAGGSANSASHAGSVNGQPTASTTGGSKASTAGSPSAGSPTSTAPGTTASSPPAAPSQQLGPALSSTPYANAAYRIYPPPKSSLAQAATAGFSVSVSTSGQKETVSVAGSNSQSSPQVSTYPVGDKVYFVEASFGDDSGTTGDYNYGDDGIVVTNPAGRIVE